MGFDAFFDLMVLDRSNPRSLIDQLDVLEARFRELPGDELPRESVPPALHRALLNARAPWQLEDPARLVARDAAGRLAAFGSALERTAAALEDVHGCLNERYFAHVARGRQLVRFDEEPAPSIDIELSPDAPSEPLD